MDCLNDWKEVITPMGLCYQLKLSQSKEYMQNDPTQSEHSVLGLIIAMNMSDTTYGIRYLST